ncbi:MAG: hypothetical protein AB2A00_19555 [Myxococcota bacterium]
MMRWCGLALLTMLAACPRPVGPPASTEQEGPCTPRRTDVIRTSGSNKVDLLIVVNSHPSMDPVLRKLPERLVTQSTAAIPSIVEKLVRERVDFHIAVAPTHLRGKLLPLPAQVLPRRCESCRYLARADCMTSLCENVRNDAAGLVDVQSDSGGDNRLTETLRNALGVVLQCGDPSPHTDPPLENAGFYREDAALVVYMIGNDADPFLQSQAGYDVALRTLRTLKGPGREDDVVLVGLSAASPDGLRAVLDDIQSGANIGTPADFCDEARKAVQGCGRASLQDQRGGQGLEGLSACNVGLAAVQPDPNLLALACDSGGVIYNTCAENWSSIINRRITSVMSNVGITLSQPAKGTTVACPGGNGSVCVEMTSQDGRVMELAGADATVTTADGASVVTINRAAQPGSTFHVTYDVAQGDARCCEGGCSMGEQCNEVGFCQLSTCEGPKSCPPDALCDPVTSTCIPSNTCTRPEHCVHGTTCDCTTSRCVPNQAACQ